MDELNKQMSEFSDASLSQREKDRIRAHLQGFIHAHPARAPFYMRALDGFSAFAERASKVQVRGAQFASAALALVLVVGTGTAYAAGNALPGNPLYGVKTNIEEPIQGAFATSAQAQAEWSSQLATKRLAEAETLAAQNKLTPQAVSTVTGGLDQATGQFDASVAEIATSSGNDAIAANLESNMAATLTANTQVLTQLQSAVPKAASSIAPLLSRVRTRAEALNQARTHLDIAVAQTDASQSNFAAAKASVALVASSSTVQKNDVSADEGTTTASVATAQTAAFNAQVTQLHADIADQLRSATGVDLPPATTSAALTATSSESTSLGASAIDASSTSDLEASTSVTQ